MAFRKIENILCKAIGLKPSSVGETVINRAVCHCMQRLKIAHEDDYVKKLTSSPNELRELIEEVVIHETWFFRDLEPFNALVDFVFKTWKPTADMTARILSAPCSTGEEPYSIVIALLQAGFPEHRFCVDAVDISRKAITRAKQAIYTGKSFRTSDLSFRRTYFRQEGDQYQLLPLVARKVRFFHGNIVEPTFLTQLGSYDVIFCRNILIYLDLRHQRQIVDTIHRLLAKDGLLITGHSEAAIFHNKKFRPVSQGRTFAFLKASPEKTPSLRSNRRNSQTRSREPLTETKESDSLDTLGILSRAREEADAGKLSDAAALCEEHLRTHGATAEGYFLLGLIREGLDESAAAYDLFRKALYLAPDHIDSLIHLGYLADKIGNQQGAANYRRRAAMLVKKE